MDVWVKSDAAAVVRVALYKVCNINVCMVAVGECHRVCLGCGFPVGGEEELSCSNRLGIAVDKRFALISAIDLR